MAKHHPNKEISQAIQYALDRGFRIIQSGRSGHPAFRLYCPEASAAGCKKSVWSTPSNPQGHANDLMRWVDACQHRNQPTDSSEGAS